MRKKVILRKPLQREQQNLIQLPKTEPNCFLGDLRRPTTHWNSKDPWLIYEVTWNDISSMGSKYTFEPFFIKFLLLLSCCTEDFPWDVKRIYFALSLKAKTARKNCWRSKLRWFGPRDHYILQQSTVRRHVWAINLLCLYVSP